MLVVVGLLGAIVFVILATAWLRLHPVIALFAAALLYGLIVGLPAIELTQAITDGFGGTVGGIGPIIIFGAIIGVFLERSGGAMRIAEALVARIGQKRVTVGLGGIGFTVSIPVFCDTGFIILSPINHALARQSGTSLAPGAIALALGLYVTHTMVPPTPGPVAAAELLGADLGLVLMCGLPVAVLTLIAGIVFATRIASRTYIEPGEADAQPEQPLSAIPEAPPAVWKALLPILLPLGLIVLRSLANLPAAPLGDGFARALIDFAGHPIIALMIGAVAALMLPSRFDKAMLSAQGWVGQAIRDCAVIILITGAGGAFGRVLQASEIGAVLGETIAAANLGIVLPVLVASTIKTAQGSSTVAIVTSAGLVAPLLPALGLDTETGRALATVAIGAGAMAVSHVNDSYFWVVSQFSRMSVRQALTLFSTGTLVQAVVASFVLLGLQAVLAAL